MSNVSETSRSRQRPHSSTNARSSATGSPGSWGRRSRVSTIGDGSRRVGGFWSPGDYVIGLVFRGRARAYPLWVVDNYHVINDRVDGERIVVAS